ncbi:MAG TPA: HD domain-containing protein [Patescibacteria group bacterium]
MQKYQKVAELVQEAYTKSKEPFAKWMWQHHVPVVAKNAEKLSDRFKANKDVAIAGAYLHDFGDAFVDRYAVNFDEISGEQMKNVLVKAGYDQEEITFIEAEVIAPHSCKAGHLPTSLEGKVLATADALAHLTTDFYLQFCWMHLPEGKTYDEYLAWVKEKLHRDYEIKIFWPEVKKEVDDRYQALKEVFESKN